MHGPFRHLFAAGLVLGLAATPLQAAEKAENAFEVRTGLHKDFTRLVLETAVPVPYKFAFPAADEIVVTLTGPAKTADLPAKGRGIIEAMALLSSFLSIFEGMMDEFRVKGFRPFTAEYTDAWLHTGQRVMVQQPPPKRGAGAEGGVGGGTQEGTAEPVRVPMIVRGISESTAALVAEDEMGRRCELYPDGNRFDFFNGLISQRT